MDAKRRAAKLAGKQHGAIAARQAIACGMTRDQIRQEVRSGRWMRRLVGTFVMAGSPPTIEQRIAVCVLSAGANAAASHASAAWLHKLVETPPDRFDVVVPHRSGCRGGRGFVIHHAVDLSKADVWTVDGIPVTCPARTLVDLASIFPPRRLAAALDSALLRGLVSIAAVRRYVQRRRLSRRRGVGELMRLLDDRTHGVPESELEREFLRILKRFGLPAPCRQTCVGPHRVGFAYPQHGILIELDGRATHGTAEAFSEDRRRDNAVVLSGWTAVLRFTWAHLTNESDYVATTLRGLLDRLSVPRG